MLFIGFFLRYEHAQFNVATKKNRRKKYISDFFNLRELIHIIMNYGSIYIYYFLHILTFKGHIHLFFKSDTILTKVVRI